MFGGKITSDRLELIKISNCKKLALLESHLFSSSSYIPEVLQIDENKDKTSALMEIYKILRPGEPTSTEVAENLF